MITKSALAKGVFVVFGLGLPIYSQWCPTGAQTQPGWADSYSANGKCYCASTFDHDIGSIPIQTPYGTKTVRQICDAIGPGPGQSGNPVYNDIQCGNGPANNAGDEDQNCCPGRVDGVPNSCQIRGPKWDLTVFGPATNQPPSVSITSPSNGATFTSPASIAVNVNASDVGGSISKVELRSNNNLVGTDNSSPYSFNVSNLTSGVYNLEARAYDNNGTTTNSSVSITVNNSSSSTPEIFAVNSSGPQYTSSEGIVYKSDANFSGGGGYSTTSPIAGTTDDVLYQSERTGNNFSYTIPVSNGTYIVTLKFAEIFWNSANSRLFNVALEGKQVISNLDIWAKVGSNTVYDENHTVTITDGAINLNFTTIKDNAKISAIVVKPANSIPSTGNLVFAANSSGPQYTSTDGTVYKADANFSGGGGFSSTSSIAGTTDDVLYQTERTGKTFSYNIPVTNGSYTVTLKFAEIFWWQAGSRSFNVSIEGNQVISNLDIWAKVGANTAYDETHQVNVTDGMLNINFTTNKDNAKVSGIVVRSNLGLKKIGQVSEINTSFSEMRLSSFTGTNLSFELPEAGTYSISVFTAEGKKILNSLNNEGQAGKNSLDLNLNNFKQGTYIVKLSNAQKSITQKFVLSEVK